MLRQMIASEFAQDGAVLWTTLMEPGLGFGRALARKRTAIVVLLCTALSLGATALILPTIDADAVAAEKLTPELTVHEREQATEAATKLYRVIRWGLAAFTPVVLALALALALWLAFKVAGAPAAFRGTFTVAAYAGVPAALKALLEVPAAMARAPVAPSQLAELLPSSLAAVLPASLPAPALAAAGAIDLFTLWAVYLVAGGMLQVSGASRLRTFGVIAVLFTAYVALFKVAPAGFGSFAGGP